MDVDDDDEYDFTYEDDDEPEPDVALENHYYSAKQLKETDQLAALDEFQVVLSLEEEDGTLGEWGFKALKQMMKIRFALGDHDEMINHYKQLLKYVKSAVTRNYSEKSIISILDYVSASDDQPLLQKIYEITLGALKESQNDRLWFKTNTKLGKLYFDRADFTRLQRVLKQLRQACTTEDGEDDLKKGTQWLEIYALEIQMYTAQKNNKKLKALYEQSKGVKSGIPHPYTMGIIRECGGKMHLREKMYGEAYQDFFDAFKNFDESGSTRRIACLKYLLLSSMLHKSEIDPFSSNEARPYKNDEEIVVFSELVRAFQAKEIRTFEQLLRDHEQSIMEDRFIQENVVDLLRSIRSECLMQLIRPYRKVQLKFISEQLNIDVPTVKALLVSCILDDQIKGRIDEVNELLLIEHHNARSSLRSDHFNALEELANNLCVLQKALNARLDVK